MNAVAFAPVHKNYGAASMECFLPLASYLAHSCGFLSGLLAGQPLVPFTEFLACLLTFILETLQPQCHRGLSCKGSSLLGAWGRGSRALQETARVPGTIILQSCGQNKVGEASGPKRRRNRPIPSWETLDVPMDAYSPSLLPAWKTSRTSKQ